MKNELPKYIFNKKYDKFYLLTEYDIVFNHDFTLKFNNFLAKNCKPSIYRALEKRVESQVIIMKTARP